MVRFIRYKLFYLILFHFYSALSSGQENQFEYIYSKYSGVDFGNYIQQTEEHNMFTNMYVFNGAGVAVGDLNNDDLPDLYFIGNQSPNRMYLNIGNFQFQDLTSIAGLGGKNAWDTSASIIDINGDGWNDIYICHAGNYLGEAELLQNIAYINNADALKNGGVPTFTNKAVELGIAGASRSIQALFFDMDNDNDLDLYVVNCPYNFFLPDDLREKAKTALPEDATDRLYENVGGSYMDITTQAGIKNWAFGLSASLGDFNQDGWMDIYVANDFSEKDIMYINQGDGIFIQGQDEMLNHMSNFSMGSAVADINNDMLEDIMVVDMMGKDNKRKKENMSAMAPEVFWENVARGEHHQYMQNTLQLNNGNQRFSEVAYLAGLTDTDWSWSTIIEDLDNDGMKDVWVTNGLLIDYRNVDVRKKVIGNSLLTLRDSFQYYSDLHPSTPLRNFCFQNRGNIEFKDVSTEWGLTYKGFSQGSAIADLDRDGDLDIVVSNTNDHVSLIRNNQAANNFLRIEPRGPSKNKNGIGLRVKIFCNGKKQMALNSPFKGFQSSTEAIIHFGLRECQEVDSLIAIWPDQKSQRLRNISTNQRIVLDYSKAKVTSLERTVMEVLFEPIDSLPGLDFHHSEEIYDDYQKEVLLPHKLSHQGPSVDIADTNGDDLDDVFIGGSAGHPSRLFMQREEGAFQITTIATQHEEKEILAVHFFDMDGDDDLDLFLGSGSNEWDADSSIYEDVLYENIGEGTYKASSALPPYLCSTSCAYSADYDGDGDLDLFVGAGIIPGRYPLSPTSYLLKNDGGKFLIDSLTIDLQAIGMVQDGAWADLDENGFPDLVLLGEWMPITILWNDGKQFHKEEWEGSQGWWQSILLQDINQDGQIDILAGNLGLNTKYKASNAEPISVYYNDIDHNGQQDIILTYVEGDKTYPVRGRQCSSQQVPKLKKQFPTYADFSAAEIEDILGLELEEEEVNYKSAYTMSSAYWLNIGNRSFERKEFPRICQNSVVRDIEVLDVNQDSLLDIILIGNRNQMEVETVRQDASIGHVLLGDGIGNFKVLPYFQSGFDASGDVREIEVLQVNDNQQVLLISQNQGPLKVIKLK